MRKGDAGSMGEGDKRMTAKTVNQEIIEALSEIPLEVEPDEYNGDKDTYIVFFVPGQNPVKFGNNKPLKERYEMQIQLFAPLYYDHLNITKQIKKALFDNYFMYPDITIIREPELGRKRIIFETEKDYKIDI